MNKYYSPKIERTIFLTGKEGLGNGISKAVNNTKMKSRNSIIVYIQNTFHCFCLYIGVSSHNIYKEQKSKNVIIIAIGYSPIFTGFSEVPDALISISDLTFTVRS